MKQPNLQNISDYFISSGSQMDEFIEATDVKLATKDESARFHTGRHLAILKPGETVFDDLEKDIDREAGIRMASTNDYKAEDFSEDLLDDAEAFIYHDLGLALIGGETTQVDRLNRPDKNYVIVPEKITAIPKNQPGILKNNSTWGIKKTKSDLSAYDGQGIKVAILDTGMDLTHPDFAGRIIRHTSFVTGQGVQDRNGHGTHCIGTACGNMDNSGKRYGVAKASEIYAGKVLSNAGSGAQAWILNGMNWATNRGCHVISMSLGSPVSNGQTFDPAYERAAQYALSKGSFVVAASGNDSSRSIGIYRPISSPANCPSIFSVAAIDKNLQVADFSNRQINPGTTMNIAGPGVNIYSSWPIPKRYHTISGTSMATPHVAGIAALIFQKNSGFTPKQIGTEIGKLATILPISGIDVGRGLCVAP